MTKSFQPILLIADADEKSMAKLEKWSRAHGYKVVKAVNGEEGFMRFRKEAPQVALISVQLDKVLGNVLCQRIKAIPFGANTRVILMSETYTSAELGQRAVKMFKADGFISRPVKEEEFAGVVPNVAPSADVNIPSIEDKTPEPAEVPLRPSGKPAAKTPVFKGSLAEQPLPKILLSFYSLRRNGKLLLERNQIQRNIYFLGGMINWATSSLRNETPLHFLVKAGMLSEDAAAEALDAMANGKNLWEYLVGNLSLTYEVLQQSMTEMAKEIVVGAFDWHEGHFEFTPEDLISENIPNLEISPVTIAFEGVARAYPLKKFMDDVFQFKESFLYRTETFEESVEHLKLTTKELRFALLIDGKTKLKDLINLGKSDVTRTVQIIWMMIKAGMVKPSDSITALKHAEFMDMGAAAKRGGSAKKVDSQKRANILKEYFRIKSSNYFEVFKLDRTSSDEQVDKAFEEVERKFHPDLFEGMDIDDIRPKLEEIMEKARAAKRVLTDPKRKVEYVEYLGNRETPSATNSAIQAELNFKEAEKCLVAGNSEKAVEGFKKAISLNSSEPDYHSYLGWALFTSAGADRSNILKEAKSCVNHAINLNPQSDKAYLIMGRILKEEGKLDLSLDHFEAALRMNEDCKPAKDGIRLIKALIRKNKLNTN